MRRFATWATYLLVVVAFIASIIVSTLVTHTGQSAFLAIISWLASDDEVEITFGPLEGSLFSKASFTRIAVADRSGEWLVVHGMSFEWQPKQLLLGTLLIKEVDIDRVDVLRAPSDPQKPASSSKSATLPRLIPISLDRFNVSEIAINETVLGTPARFTLTGAAHFHDSDQGADAQLKLERLDAPDTALVAELNFLPEHNRLTLNINGNEAPGGIVAQIAGLPSTLPLKLVLQGDGMLDAWRGSYSLQVSENPFIAGTMSIDRAAIGHSFSAKLNGFVDAIAPPEWRGILSGKTTASLSGTMADGGLIVIDEAVASNDALRFSASGRYNSGDDELSGQAHLNLSRTDGAPVALPIQPNASSSMTYLDVAINIPNASKANPATLALTARSITGPSIAAQQVEVIGELNRPKRKPLEGTYKLSASIQGLKHADEQLAVVTGEKVEFQTYGIITGLQHIEVSEFGLNFATLDIRGSGTLSGDEFKGQAKATANDLNPILKLASIDAAGSATLDTKAAFKVDGTQFDVVVNGTSPSLKLSSNNGAPRDLGSISLGFKANRNRGGATNIHDAEVVSNSFNAKARMTIDKTELDAQASAEISELALMSTELAGRAKLSAKVSGLITDLRSQIAVESQSISVAGRSITNLNANLVGSGPLERHAVHTNIAAMVTDRKLEAKSQFVVQANELNVDNFELGWGALAVHGKAKLAPTYAEGKFHVDHGNLSQLSTLVGSSLAGRLTAELDLITIDSKPATRIKLITTGATFDATRVGKFDIAATVPLHDPLRLSEAKIEARTITSGQVRVDNAAINVMPGQDGLRLTMTAKADEADVKLGARLNVIDDTTIVTLEDFRAERHGKTLKSSQHATLRLRDGIAAIRGLSIQSRDGRLDVDGQASKNALDLNVKLADMPADLTDMIDPSIGARGRLSGSARIKGSPSKPIVDFEAKWPGASAASIDKLGIPPIDLRTSGKLADAVLSTRLDASGHDGFVFNSQVQLGGKEFSALTGTASGRVPLQIANAVLAERGTRLSGAALINAKLDGTVEKPKVIGDVRIEDASVRDVASGATLQQVTGTVTFNESALQIASVRGAGDKGGELSVRGGISWSTPTTVVEDISIALTSFKIDDKKQISGEVDGSLKVSGPIDNLIATGRVDIKHLDVLVPEQLPRSVAALNLKHVNAPPQIIKREEQTSNARSSGGTSVVGLQIGIFALDRISVRGRGLNALLGGELNLRGTAADPIADGAFELVQGRLSLLGRQLDFQRGSATFTGTLEPYLDLEATAEADGVTITVAVTGPASRPEFKFSSQPDLPDDEILARLVFNKALIKLTPMQIAQLASEVDKIGGLSSGPGILDKLRSTIGIDRLDVATEKNGSTSVSAGSYVGDSTYVGVRQGLGAGSSRIVIDHDLTKHLKARGEIGADGNSKLGIGVEWDY